MVRVRNTARASQGIYADGRLVWIKPGEETSVELDDATVERMRRQPIWVIDGQEPADGSKTLEQTNAELTSETAPMESTKAPGPSDDEFADRIDGLQRENQALTDQLADSDKRVAELSAQLGERDARLDDLGGLVAQMTPELESLREQLRDAEDDGSAEVTGDLIAKHQKGGKYAVLRAGEPVVSGLSKAESRDFNLLSAEDKEKFVAERAQA